ncbi:MAG TPA: hypothetical protein VLU41_00015, partial [Ideonella sp.]|nr:hypothetical protein [Ideonella sp.]
GTADLLRLVTVTVSWTDRAGATDSVTLQTIVARADPADIGSVALPPPGNAPWRRTRDRSLDIPFEAAQLGGANRGRSTLGWTAGSALVFDDAAGTATALCSAPVADTTDLASTCIALQGLLLEGYIDGDLPAAPPALGFDRLQHVLAGTAPECVVLPAADQNSGASIGDRLRYRCLIQPGDHDADPATPRVWSGRLRFAGLAAGSTVCRYARAADTTVNAEHPETYTLVAQSLSQQNYAISASGSCPEGSVPQQAA